MQPEIRFLLLSALSLKLRAQFLNSAAGSLVYCVRHSSEVIGEQMNRNKEMSIMLSAKLAACTR